MRFQTWLLLIVCGCAALTGCARTETFDISVRNDTESPLTLALTKDGPPFEHTWAGPEDLAIGSPKADERHSYVVLPPGREADVTVQGKFSRGTQGFLRVYRGDLPVSDMTAIGPASPNRLDLPLRPGPNRFAIGEANGRLAERRGGATSSPPPAASPASEPVR